MNEQIECFSDHLAALILVGMVVLFKIYKYTKNKIYRKKNLFVLGQLITLRKKEKTNFLAH